MADGRKIAVLGTANTTDTTDTEKTDGQITFIGFWDEGKNTWMGFNPDGTATEMQFGYTVDGENLKPAGNASAVDSPDLTAMSQEEFNHPYVIAHELAEKGVNWFGEVPQFDGFVTAFSRQIIIPYSKNNPDQKNSQKAMTETQAKEFAKLIDWMAESPKIENALKQTQLSFILKIYENVWLSSPTFISTQSTTAYDQLVWGIAFRQDYVDNPDIAGEVNQDKKNDGKNAKYLVTIAHELAAMLQAQAEDPANFYTGLYNDPAILPTEIQLATPLINQFQPDSFEKIAADAWLTLHIQNMQPETTLN